MKTLLILGCLLFASGAHAADCYTNPRGKVICSNGTKAVVANPNTGTVTTAQRNAYGTTSAQSSTGARAAYNPRTGNAAASQTNSNGVTTTKTLRGGEAKTKNGKGVVQGPGGTTCAKGANSSGCTR